MLRFFIRDMLWFTLSWALALCWFMDHRRIEQLGAEYSRDVNQALDAAAKAERNFASRQKFQPSAAVSYAQDNAAAKEVNKQESAKLQGEWRVSNLIGKTVVRVTMMTIPFVARGEDGSPPF
jgi:hypothetical protein